jgi:hypothetical protein
MRKGMIFLFPKLYRVVFFFSFFCFHTSQTYSSGLSPAYFRTIAAGNWSSPQIWEKADDIHFSVNRGPADSFPDSNAVKIIIKHEVHIDFDLKVRQLFISTEGYLILPQERKLRINGDDGVDFLVSGIFEDKASSGNGVSFHSEASWALENTGTFIKTNNSSAAVYRNHYHSGMSNIPPAAKWILRREAPNHNPSLTSINTVYPTLIVENHVNDHWHPIITSRFTGNSTNVQILGDLIIGKNGQGTLTFYNQNYHSQPTAVLGNIIIGQGSELTNLGSVEGTGFALSKNLLVEKGAALLLSRNGTLALSGTQKQFIQGEGDISMGILKINNQDTELHQSLTIQSELSFLHGNIITHEYHLLLKDEAIIKGEDKEKGVIGNLYMTRVIEANKEYFGGIGLAIDASRYNQNLGEVLVKRLTHNPVEINGNRSIQRVWNIISEYEPDNSVTLGLSWLESEEDQYFDHASVQVWKSIDEGATWHNAEIDFIDQEQRYLEVSTSSFSMWTISDGQNPLPVRWLGFKGTPYSDIAILEWETTHEINNKGFEIEKSFDGVVFFAIGFVESHGGVANTNVYVYQDKSFQHSAYYRIKQIDFDGKFAHSNTLFLAKKQNEFQIDIYPNPTAGKLYVGYPGSEELTIGVYAYDGRLIHHFIGRADQWNNVGTNFISTAKPGTYYLSILAPFGRQVHKVIKL